MLQLYRYDRVETACRLVRQVHAYTRQAPMKLQTADQPDRLTLVDAGTFHVWCNAALVLEIAVARNVAVYMYCEWQPA
ncbi:hypothetical protein CGRA01v4_06132 [Colletotrichum graminicola]|nr:hypothetical protein CGRA01v4_06132 [Colletotrichum graminicola]